MYGVVHKKEEAEKIFNTARRKKQHTALVSKSVKKETSFSTKIRLDFKIIDAKPRLTLLSNTKNQS